MAAKKKPTLTTLKKKRDNLTKKIASEKKTRDKLSQKIASRRR